MRCAEFVELVTAYLDGALDERSHARFERHLRRCEGCERYLEQLRAVGPAVGALPPQPLPGEDRDRLLAVFRDWHEA
ncbi:zf-HC2 domain-containing protein [Nonomuraea soli]